MQSNGPLPKFAAWQHLKYFMEITQYYLDSGHVGTCVSTEGAVSNEKAISVAL
jgi:hypothetical protein